MTSSEKHNIKQGRLVRVVPLGYKMDWGLNGRNVTLDENRAPFIAHAFVLLAGGMSIRQAHREVSAAGLTNLEGQPISWTSFVVIVKNPFYTGRMRYRGELYKGDYQPLVGIELFDRANKSHKMKD